MWRLLDAATAADGSVWQAYLNKGTGSKAGPDEMDSVIVLISEAAAPGGRWKKLGNRRR